MTHAQIAAIVIAAAALLGRPAAAEDLVALADVPPHVLETAEAIAPGLTIDAVYVEVEGGRRVYEFVGTDAQGRRIEVDVDETGALEEIEMEQSADDLPAAVARAVSATEPGLAITRVETSVRPDGTFTYEIEGERPDGARIAMTLAEDGAVLEDVAAANS